MAKFTNPGDAAEYYERMFDERAECMYGMEDEDTKEVLTAEARMKLQQTEEIIMHMRGEISGKHLEKFNQVLKQRATKDYSASLEEKNLPDVFVQWIREASVTFRTRIRARKNPAFERIAEERVLAMSKKITKQVSHIAKATRDRMEQLPQILEGAFHIVVGLDELQRGTFSKAYDLKASDLFLQHKIFVEGEPLQNVAERILQDPRMPKDLSEPEMREIIVHCARQDLNEFYSTTMRHHVLTLLGKVAAYMPTLR